LKSLQKSKIRFLIAAVVILAVINAVAFAVPFSRRDSYWIGYGFTMLALLLSFGAAGYAFREESPQSRFYSLPVPALLWGYLLIQAALGLVFMAFSAIPVWISVILSVILLAAVLIGLLAADAGKEAAEKSDQKVKSKTLYIRSLQNDVEALQKSVKDPALSHSLKETAEAFRYSDPMSSDQLVLLENRIQAETQKLQGAVAEGDTETAGAQCALLCQLLAERGQQCKLLK
jgi:hypothetical protein